MGLPSFTILVMHHALALLFTSPSCNAHGRHTGWKACHPVLPTYLPTYLHMWHQRCMHLSFLWFSSTAFASYVCCVAQSANSTVESSWDLSKRRRCDYCCAWSMHACPPGCHASLVRCAHVRAGARACRRDGRPRPRPAAPRRQVRRGQHGPSHHHHAQDGCQRLKQGPAASAASAVAASYRQAVLRCCVALRSTQGGGGSQSPLQMMLCRHGA
jgi:hypothetical protein